MNLKAIIATLPLLRRLWRWLPGPLRIIALAIAGVIAVKRVFSGDDTEAGSAGAGDGAADDVGSGSERRSA